ncbi:hypothetical protein BC940DRAFT_305340 [Gongronella butleri]|nr:hypothetical protein BC940DRAFT_305340 [Gongronella butleri]
MRRNDPYRKARKTHSPANSHESNRVDTEAHSRSASDSSTARLTHANYEEYYADDPYARHNHHQRSESATQAANASPATLVAQEPQVTPPATEAKPPLQPRTHSYLPYSHHQPDKRLYQTPTSSLALEEGGRLQSFSTQDKPVGSLLQDNLLMDVVDTPIRQHKTELPAVDLPPTRKKKQVWCACTRRIKISVVAVIFAVIITILLYFVCPRVFSLNNPSAQMYFNGSFSYDGTWYPNFSNPTYFSNNWNISFVADNSANWVPIHVTNLNLALVDAITGKQIGTGQSGGFTLPPRSQGQVIMFNTSIGYNATSANDQTMTDIASACIKVYNLPNGPSNASTAQDFQVQFIIDYHIASLAWAPRVTINDNTFVCPENSS